MRSGPDIDGNPAPVLNRETGMFWLLFCKNLSDGAEDLIVQGKAPRTENARPEPSFVFESCKYFAPGKIDGPDQLR